uniref:Putative trypsin inhibitor like cysteine rich domain protein n=1 Tax=Psorophora albipes TaxID=869069 RepID=T1DJ89_9DIPT
MFKIVTFALLYITMAASVLYPLDEVCTGAHEEYSSCGTSCPETSCSTIGQPIACKEVCREGCFCRSGYVRVSWENRTCVERGQCFNRTV